MTRRVLLILLVAIVSLILWKRKAILQLFKGPRGTEAPRRAAVPEPERAAVAIVRKDSAEAMVRRAVELLGGFEQFRFPESTVLVKPNVVSDQPAPSTTDPRVVAAVVKVLYEEGARKVYVGDMSAAIRLRTMENMARTGILAAAEGEGAQIVAFEDHSWVEVPLQGARYVRKALVTEWIYKVDRVVNLPVVKTHRSASYSICLKNFIGCTHIRQRPYLIDPDHWEEVVAEFNLAYTPDLNIADATTAMVEGGPWQGKGLRTGVLIAGRDRVAVDAAGLGLIGSAGLWPMVTGKGVWEQKQIVRALELGIGKGPDRIDLLTDGSGEDFKELARSIEDHTGLAAKGPPPS